MANKKEEKQSTEVTVTDTSGTNVKFDLSTASETVKGLYMRALKLKQHQVDLETRLVENHILINDYVAKIVDAQAMESNKEKSNDEDDKEVAK